MEQQKQALELVLASTSRYRRELLARLGLPFTWQSPGVDEGAIPGESAVALSERLSVAKALSIARRFPSAVVIGADQVAECRGSMVGKPGSESLAVAQLQQFSGQEVLFFSSLAVVCANAGFREVGTVTTRAWFRELKENEIRRYVALDDPLDCTGSFKSEAAGPVLLRSLVSDDPTAIIGLPLIALAEMLRSAGFQLP